MFSSYKVHPQGCKIPLTRSHGEWMMVHGEWKIQKFLGIFLYLTISDTSRASGHFDDYTALHPVASVHNPQQKLSISWNSLRALMGSILFLPALRLIRPMGASSRRTSGFFAGGFIFQATIVCEKKRRDGGMINLWMQWLLVSLSCKISCAIFSIHLWQGSYCTKSASLTHLSTKWLPK